MTPPTACYQEPCGNLICCNLRVQFDNAFILSIQVSTPTEQKRRLHQEAIWSIITGRKFAPLGMIYVVKGAV